MKLFVKNSQNGCGTRESSSGIPTRVLRLADVDGYHGIVSTSGREVRLSKAERDKYMLSKGDIVAIRVNGSRSIAGVCFVAKGDGEWCFCDHFIRLSVDSSVVSPEYLAYALRGGFARRQVEIGMVSSAGQHTISQTTLEAVEIRLAPRGEQSRIVAKLDAIFAQTRALKARLEQLPARLDQLKRSILAAAFRGDLTADWRRTNSANESAKAFVVQLAERRMALQERVPERRKTMTPAVARDELLIPDSWEFARLIDLVDPVRGIPYGIVQTGNHVEGGVPTVRCGDIKDFAIQRDGLKSVAPAIAQNYARTTLKGGELLLAVRGSAGGAALATGELAGANISREVAMIPLLHGLVPEFYLYALASPQAQLAIAGQMKGVAQQGINLEDVRQLVVPVPPPAEQQTIAFVVKNMLEMLDRLKLATLSADARMSRVEQAALAKAFRGELVPQDPNDEPASVLLERIRASRATAEAPTGRRAARTKR